MDDVEVGVDVAVAVAELGAVADRLSSQTSSGSTSANSLSTRSQAIRFDSAALSAVTRAALSATSASCCCSRFWAGTGIAASSACFCASSSWRDLTLPCALRRSTEIMRLTSTRPPITVAATAVGTGGPVRRALSFGRRLTARIQSSIPRPIAIASDPTCSASLIFLPTFTRASGSPGRTPTPISV